ncbi:MAG TPA: hypothetical protein VNT26_21445 [Candidatus Sulfotelmatobacter sp.]|nr:hypothetical protein [Candidatus Sulfotelmatobacter sp.]HWI55927.1 hypothetical protein [Bacillota bacterium]
MKKFGPFSSARSRLSLLSLACLAIGALVLLRVSRPAPFLVLHQPVQMPTPFRDQVARWIPGSPGWAWAWRVEQAVFGRRKLVNLYAEVLAVTDSSPPGLSNLLPEPPSFSGSNGLRVWLLGSERFKALRDQLHQAPGTTLLFRPRISTADGIESRLVQGNSIALNGTTNQVGLAFGCFARVRSDATDLTTCLTLSEIITNQAVALGDSSSPTLISIQTNLDTALRLHIPKGSGCFLLDGSSLDSHRKRIGLLLEPPQPKA